MTPGTSEYPSIMVQGLGLRVQVLKFRVSGLGFSLRLRVSQMTKHQILGPAG